MDFETLTHLAKIAPQGPTDCLFLHSPSPPLLHAGPTCGLFPSPPSLSGGPTLAPPFCHTLFLEGKPNANHVRARIRTHVHSDYIIVHHHTMIKVNSGKVLYLQQDVQDIHIV
jgi:hypothetical protein